MEIITGYTGIEHVQSADDASLYRGIFGLDDYVLNVGSKLEANIVDNNTVRIMDGDVIIQGHQGRIRANDYNEVTIDNGTPGEQRNDLIVARYLKNTETGVESIKLEVVKGSPAVEATDPETIKEDLKIGGTQRDFALYRVSLDGINFKSVTSLFSTTPSLAVVEQNIDEHLAENVSQFGGVHGFGIERGIWTPTLEGGDVSGNNTYAVQKGMYEKQGNQVTLYFDLALSRLDTNMSGIVKLVGLPFSIHLHGMVFGANLYNVVNVDIEKDILMRAPTRSLITSSLFMYNLNNTGTLSAFGTSSLKNNTEISGIIQFSLE